MNSISTRIEILIIFTITFFISFYMQDHIFKSKVNKIIKENPNITLKEFMEVEDEQKVYKSQYIR